MDRIPDTSPLEEASITIEEQIEESKRKLRERVPPPPEDRTELNRLAVERIDDSLMESLRPFVIYGGKGPDPSAPELWFPAFFKIEAEGLLPMSFTTVRVPGGNLVRVNSIRVGDAKFGTDWDAAIVAAAEEGRSK